MPEIRPDMSDESRCISVHWNLPVQCVLPVGHREHWHEGWHPETGNRIRYQRSMGGYVTEELNDGWHDLQIPPPGGFCNDQYISTFGDVPLVRCTGQYGHGWNHRAVVDGCTYSWNTPLPKDLTVDQLTRDVKQLRGMLVAAHTRIAELETALAAAGRSLSCFIFDSDDPGVDALGAQWLYHQAMPNADDPFAQPRAFRSSVFSEAATEVEKLDAQAPDDRRNRSQAYLDGYSDGVQDAAERLEKLADQAAEGTEAAS